MPAPTFRVRLEGRNFHLAEGGRVRRLGFHVTVFVHASDPEAAREAAVRALGADEHLLSCLRNAPDDPPAVFSLEATQVDPAVAPPPKRSAFRFFADDGTAPEPGSTPPA